mmetsp:Transcript_10684/g.24344  ORF Transcript_10684/g.24344 Transcript_10684/m.24344 type:complete len:326 (-) Transcript_10684:135-1112(-)
MVTVGALNAQKEAESIGRICKWVGGAGGAIGGSMVGAFSGVAAGPAGMVAGGIAGSVAGANMGLKGAEVAEKSVLDSYNVHTNICSVCHSRFETTKEETDELHDFCQRCRHKREMGEPPRAPARQNSNSSQSRHWPPMPRGGPPHNDFPESMDFPAMPSASRTQKYSSSSSGTRPVAGLDYGGVPGTDCRQGKSKWRPGQACEVLSSKGSWKLAMVKAIGDKHVKVVYGDGSGEKEVIWSHVRSLPETELPMASCTSTGGPSGGTLDIQAVPQVGQRCQVQSSAGDWKPAKVLEVVPGDHVTCQYADTGNTKGIPWKFIPTNLRF